MTYAAAYLCVVAEHQRDVFHRHAAHAPAIDTLEEPACGHAHPSVTLRSATRQSQTDRRTSLDPDARCR